MSKMSESAIAQPKLKQLEDEIQVGMAELEGMLR